MGGWVSGVAENFASRNIERLDDDQVRAVIAASYALDRNLGLYVEVAAETGAGQVRFLASSLAICRTAARRA